MRHASAPIVAVLMLFTAAAVHADGAWIVPLDSPVYGLTEEHFIRNGAVPPFENTPVTAGEIRDRIDRLGHAVDDGLMDRLRLRFEPITPIVEVGLSARYEGETDRLRLVTRSGEQYLDYLPLYSAGEVPSLLKLGLVTDWGGFSLLFQPELREALPSLLADYDVFNFPYRLVDFDQNFPFRGGISFYNSFFELRVAREKLQLGPGRWSSLSVNRNLPYLDYVKLHFPVDWFDFSSYLIRLNPIISPAESAWLESMPAAENPEVNARSEEPYSERSKYLAVHKLAVSPWKWMNLALAEFNMIGGRTPQLVDFSPLIIFHNNFSEGCNKQSLSVTADVVPIPGIRLYGEWYLFDVRVADEPDPRYKPGAGAYQAGLTVLSKPFFPMAWGRLRLDAEVSLVDPWCYASWYDLKKYTSRIVWVETGAGARYWTDYPLGYYLGPDCLDINIRLTAGKPGKWEAELSGNRNGIGSIDLYGWGNDNLFSQTENPEMPLTGAPTSRPGIPVQWTNKLKAAFSYTLLEAITLTAWYSITYVENRFHVQDSNFVFHSVGIQGTWKPF